MDTKQLLEKSELKLGEVKKQFEIDEKKTKPIN